jgi:hypothetical protein
MIRYLLGIAAGVVVMGGAWALTTPAQDQPDTTQRLLEDLHATNTMFSIEFVYDVPRLGGGVDVGGGSALQLHRAGTDVVCLRLPATSTTQVTCIPYSNVNAIFFAE